MHFIDITKSPCSRIATDVVLASDCRRQQPRSKIRNQAKVAASSPKSRGRDQARVAAAALRMTVSRSLHEAAGKIVSRVKMQDEHNLLKMILSPSFHIEVTQVSPGNKEPAEDDYISNEAAKPRNTEFALTESDLDVLDHAKLVDNSFAGNAKKAQAMHNRSLETSDCCKLRVNVLLVVSVCESKVKKVGLTRGL